MRQILLSLFALPLMLSPIAAAAQDASYYHCENKRIRLNIPSMPLGKALEKFTAATRCPVSLDTQEVANTDVRLVPTFPVKGRMLPAKALNKMLSSSPLKSRVIKGGYSIYMN